VSLVLRAYRLFKIFSFSEFIKRRENEQKGEFKKFKNAISEKGLLKNFFVIYSIIIIIGLILSFSGFAGKIECVNDPSTITGLVSLITIIIIFLFFSGVFIWYAIKLKKQPKDIFYLRIELIMVGVIGFIGWSLVLILDFFTQTDFQNEITFLIYYLLVHGFVILLPLYLTFKPKPKIFEIENKKSFQLVLDEEELLKLFINFITAMLAYEEIYFYLEILKLEKSSEEKILQHANEIIHKFILPYSEYEINIDYDLRNKILSDFKNNEVESLYTAKTYIIEHMAEDTFPLFVKSAEYKNFMNYTADLKKQLY